MKVLRIILAIVIVLWALGFVTALVGGIVVGRPDLFLGYLALTMMLLLVLAAVGGAIHVAWSLIKDD